jgi:hypothetical protein
MKNPLIKISILFTLLLLAGCEGAEKSQVERWGLGKVESEYVSLDGANHAIIIKGYRVVDGITYFEVYYPASSEFERYPDDTFKGQDRYFLADEVISSGRRYGGDYLIISPKDTGDRNYHVATPK